MGNTEEHYRRIVLGLDEVGSKGQPPYDRTTGAGWVDAFGGDYADARSKQIPVHLFLVEITGALTRSSVQVLTWLASRVSGRKKHVDTTVYGSSRASPRSFRPHHLANIAAAAVHTDSGAIVHSALARAKALIAGA